MWQRQLCHTYHLSISRYRKCGSLKNYLPNHFEPEYPDNLKKLKRRKTLQGRKNLLVIDFRCYRLIMATDFVIDLWCYRFITSYPYNSKIKSGQIPPRA